MHKNLHATKCTFTPGLLFVGGLQMHTCPVGERPEGTEGCHAYTVLCKKPWRLLKIKVPCRISKALETKPDNLILKIQEKFRWEFPRYPMLMQLTTIVETQTRKRRGIPMPPNRYQIANYGSWEACIYAPEQGILSLKRLQIHQLQFCNCQFSWIGFNIPWHFPLFIISCPVIQ